MDKRRHKAYVVTDDEHWFAFRAVCLVRGVTIEHALGRLVERVCESSAPMDARKVIEGAPAPSKRPKRAARPKKRTAGEKYGANTRSSRPKGTTDS